MFGVFQILAQLLQRELAWYAGFWIYWPLWCLLFPLWILGRDRFLGIFRHQPLDLLTLGLLLFPPMISFIGRFFMDYVPQQGWKLLLWVAMCFSNGILEEVLWRGVFIELFPNDLWWGWFWSTIWFALWHFAPGSVSTMNALTLVGGAAVFGGIWGLLARKTGTICWSALSHILAGLARL